MNARVAVAPFALVLVVVTPAIVDSATTPDTPKPPESTLTVSVSDSTQFLRLVDAVEPTAGVISPLVDASGRTVSQAEAVDAGSSEFSSSCTSATSHDTGKRGEDGAKTESCIRVTGLEPASSVTGKIAGTGVTLTTNYARGLGWPLVVALLGGVLGFLLLVWAGLIRRRARAVLVEDLLERNAAPGGAGIRELRSWAEGLRLLGKDDAEIAEKLDTAMRVVPGRAQLIRAKLRKAIDTAPTEALKNKLRENTATALTIADYYDEDGEELDPSPLLAPLSEIDHVRNALSQLEAMAAAVRGADDSAQKQTALHAIEAARASAEAVVDEAGRSTMSDLVKEAKSATAAAMGHRDAVAEDIESQTEPIKNPDLSVDRVKRVTAKALFAIYVLAIVALALVALYLANYASKPAFGTRDDFLALFIAATGSGAVGTIAGAGGFWYVDEKKFTGP